MPEINEDKILEEHLRQLLKNHSVPFSEEQRAEIIREFENFKHHSNRINISFKDIIQNKTLQIIVLSVISVIVLIYLFTQLFPAEHSNDDNPHNSNQNFTDISDSIPASEDSVSSFGTNTVAPLKNDSLKSINTYSESSTEHQAAKQEAGKNSVQQSMQNNNNSVQTVVRDSIPQLPPKKKKKRKKDTLNTNTEEGPLPVLEFKRQFNGNTKEEE